MDLWKKINRCCVNHLIYGILLWQHSRWKQAFFPSRESESDDKAEGFLSLRRRMGRTWNPCGPGQGKVVKAMPPCWTEQFRVTVYLELKRKEKGSSSSSISHFSNPNHLPAQQCLLFLSMPFQSLLSLILLFTISIAPFLLLFLLLISICLPSRYFTLFFKQSYSGTGLIKENI